MRIKEEQREKLKQVTDLTLDIQELGAYVFIKYFGTTSTVDIDIFKCKWNEDLKADYHTRYFLTNGTGTPFCEGVDECIESLKIIKKELSKNI